MLVPESSLLNERDFIELGGDFISLITSVEPAQDSEGSDQRFYWRRTLEIIS